MGGIGGRSREGRDPVLWAFALTGLAVIVTFVALSASVRYLLTAVPTWLASIAILVGVRRNRPASPGAWYVFAVGTVFYAAADTLWADYQARGAEVPFPGPVDVLYLVAYLLYAAGLVMLAGRPVGRVQWAALLDAGIVTLGFATLSWVFIIGPYIRSNLSPLSLAVSIAYPVADLVLLCLAARLVLVTGSRSLSFGLLIGWLVATLAADTMYYGTQASSGTPFAEYLSEAVWMLSEILLGAAALHRSVSRSSGEPGGQNGTLSRTRLAALLALALMGPAVVESDVGGIREDPDHIAVVVGMVACLAVLLVLRLSLLARYAQTRAAEAHRRARALEESMHEQTVLQQRLSHQAFHDPLTGLANRLLLGERLDHLTGRTGQRSAGLLLLDLDGFKDVNDSFGHPVGDELLVAIAHRLLGGVRRRDLVARLGGDEFAVLVDELGEERLHDYAGRILGQFGDPFVVGGNRVIHMTVSLGARLISGPTGAADALRDADVALYVAKAEGKNRLVFFEPYMRIASQEHVRMSQDLWAALDRDEFMIHYQPVVELGTGEIDSVEALIRWAWPGGGLVPPSRFIPIAEETGVIGAIGAWVLRQACVQARHWQDSSPSHRELAVVVNVSGHQLKDPGFPEEVIGILESTGLAATSLMLEITESVLVADPDAATHLAKLRELGIRICVEEFGTGSSLACLRNYPIDQIKIDQSFVNAEDAEKDDTLLRAIIHLGRSLELDIVAEGIETAEQAERLCELGCPRGQGFHFGRPMTGQAMEWYLHSHPRGRHHSTR